VCVAKTRSGRTAVYVLFRTLLNIRIPHVVLRVHRELYRALSEMADKACGQNELPRFSNGESTYVSTDAKTPNTLRLMGELTVRTISDTHQKLTSGLQSTDALLIDVREATDVDLTFVQLIEAARRSASKDGKRLTMATPFPPALRDLLERGGFLSAGDSAPFWKQRE
jgi:ABC-type transporter Mla MlaB component